MPMPLDDPRWSLLTTAYGDTTDLRDFLRQAYAQGLQDDLLGEIMNQVCHQGDSSTAMYAAPAHLLELAWETKEPLRTEVIICAGMIYGNACLPDAPACPDFLRDDFEVTREPLLEAMRGSLTGELSFSDLQYRFAAIAGLLRHGRFGRVIEGIDFHEDRFYHTGADEPID